MRTCGVAIVLVLGGCLRWPGPTGSPKVLNLFGGESGYELVHLPALARVEVYRGPAGEGPLKLGDAELGRLSEILRAGSTYEDAKPANVAFRRDAAVRFAGVKRTIDVAVSYGQREVRVTDGVTEVGRATVVDSRVEEIKKLIDSAR
jgi:hypothetical protein